MDILNLNYFTGSASAATMNVNGVYSEYDILEHFEWLSTLKSCKPAVLP